MKLKENKGYWSQSFGVAPAMIYAWERLDRGGQVFVKYTNPAKSGRDRREKEKLPGNLTVRDAKGRLDKKKIREVGEAVQRLQAMLLLGVQRDLPDQTESPLSLRDGFERALDTTTGKYATKSLRWQEVHRAQEKLERILGHGTPWIELKSSDVRKVWRTLAQDYAHGRSTCGARQTEVTADSLYSVAAWLRDEDVLPADALLPASKWRRKLKDEWEQITGGSAKPDRPRHAPQELQKLFARTHDPRVDPRFGLAFDLGGEQRLGQVLRCMRSDLELPAIDLDRVGQLPPGRLGHLRVPEAGKKRSAPIVFTSEQRLALEAAFIGYLADLETAWLEGALRDYPLFPAGRLKKGKAKVNGRETPMTRDAALKMFHHLETVAGVPSVRGRGWYGIRRIATDLAEDFEKDERVLNSITGHRDSATRRLVYQDAERPEILNQAALVRAKIRRGVGTQDEPAERERAQSA